MATTRRDPKKSHDKTQIPTAGAISGTGITTGVVTPDHLGTGARDGTKFLRDDGVWSSIAGGTPIASSTVTGTVKTNTNHADPVVYLKSEVDTLLAAENDLPTGGTTDQVLAKVDATDYNVAWVTPGGTGGTGPDVPIGTPTAQDEEFDNATLDAKWTVDTNISAANTKVYGLYGTYCMIECPGSVAGDVLQLSQTFAPGASTACSLTAKLSSLGQANYHGCFIYLASGAGAPAAWVRIGLEHRDGVHRVYVDNRTGSSTTFNAVSGDLNSIVMHNDHVYVHMQRTTGNVYSFYYSFNGLSWRKATTTQSNTQTISHILVAISGGGSTKYSKSGIDWIRRDWITLL